MWNNLTADERLEMILALFAVFTLGLRAAQWIYTREAAKVEA